ncbi:cytochrome P450 [Nonomuraea endophytica]|uniref:cytochrome P450 n=1 Tax=Nonomuraea endophytica TaxID=714136 RepID=UPI0037CBB142
MADVEHDYPMARACPYHPPSGFARLRETGPVTKVRLASGDTAWAVTGHRESRALFADPRISSDATRPGFPEPGRRKGAPKPDPAAKRRAQTFVEMDDPEHRSHRRVLIPAFTVRQAAAMRPLIRKTTDTLLRRLRAAGPPADLVSRYAVPLPSAMLCHLLGLPDEDHTFFRARADAAVLDKRSSGQAFGELRAYFERLLAAGPREGVLGLLTSGGSRAGLEPSRMANLCVMLVVAGHETSADMIAMGTLALLTHTRQLAALRDDPSLAPAAVEELLRFVSVPETVIRMAADDIEIAGVRIHAGDAVFLLPGGANRDAAAFPDPDVLDVRRSARHHLAFGYGVHQCLGQNLARVELEIALSALLEHLPGLRLAVPAERLTRRAPGGLQGVGELPVAW